MSGLLICAAVGLASLGAMLAGVSGAMFEEVSDSATRFVLAFGLALIAVALWLAYAAGGA